MKIAIILGTRPEIIKLSPIIRECEQQGIDYFIVHTNQHYSVGMDRVFFEELKLPLPKYNLNVHDLGQGAMVGNMLIALEPILLDEQPDWILVQGDTNTVLSGALSAAKLGIRLGHVEAGLRSYDRSMPEEVNRVITDHLADALFCPTPDSADILSSEGIDHAKIVVTGNTIVEAVTENLKLAETGKHLAIDKDQDYFLLTMHRPSNVDNQAKLSKLISALENLAKKHGCPIIFPIHPRTKAAITRFRLTLDQSKINLIEPTGYLDMLLLEKHAKLILTDSGGLQEEACILKVPCVTLRDNTERPETITAGANMLYGGEQQLESSVGEMLKKARNWPNPYGDGNTSTKILAALVNYA